MWQGIADNLNSALSTWNTKLSEISTLIMTSPQDYNSGLWSVIVDINGALKAVGLSLLVIFFAMNVAQTTHSLVELKRPEAAVKLFIRFAIAKAVVTYAMDILLAMLAIGQHIISESGGRVLGVGTLALPSEIVTAIQNLEFIKGIVPWVISLIGSLAVTVISFMIILAVYGRVFKIYMYVAIAPIPLSTFAGGESVSQIGKAFLKSFAGVCLEGAIIILALVIFSNVSSTLSIAASGSTDPGTMIGDYLKQTIFSMLILLGTVKMSDRVVKDMMAL